jgi:excinuclease ABC subunit C
MRDRVSELDDIPGVGPRTRQRLVEHFGSVRGIKQASHDALTAVVSPSVAEKIRRHFAEEGATENSAALVQIS